MTAFDAFDALLDSAQVDAFGQTITIDGVDVSAIEDTITTYLGDQASDVNVWQVATALLPNQFKRGYLVLINGVEHRVGKIHPKDGSNTPFELENRS